MQDRKERPRRREEVHVDKATLVLSVPSPLKYRLAAAAAARKVSMTRLVVEMLEQHLANVDAARKVVAGERRT